jgi:predicted porin
MQKKLIALAITAAFASAPAFADTNVYGRFDVGYGSVSNTNTTTTGVSSKTGESGTAFSQNNTSMFGVKSVVDVNNGMKITSQLEMGLSSNPGSDANFNGGVIKTGTTGHAGFAPNTTIGVDRVLTVGLDLGEGTTLTAGKMSSPLRGIVYHDDSIYGANLVGNLVTMDSAVTARTTALVAAHNFGAVTGTFGVLSNTTTADGNVDNKNGNGFEATAAYKQDALWVSGGYRSLKSTTGTITTLTDVTGKVMILAAAYDLGMAKIDGQFVTAKSDDALNAGSSTKQTYETVRVSAPFTSDLVAYAEMSFGKHQTAPGNEPKMNGFGVGAQYHLSKNDFLYAHIGTAKQDNTLVSAGSKVDQVAFGLLTKF